MDDGFIRKKIQELDNEIASANIILKGMEDAKTGNRLANPKLYHILQAKVSDWTNKRNKLLELLVKSLRK